MDYSNDDDDDDCEGTDYENIDGIMMMVMMKTILRLLNRGHKWGVLAMTIMRTI